MPEIINRIVRRLPNVIFPRSAKAVEDILSTPLSAPTPEEAWEQDFQLMGKEIREAISKTTRRYGHG